MALCPYLSASLLIFICISIIIAQFGIVNVFFKIIQKNTHFVTICQILTHNSTHFV